MAEKTYRTSELARAVGIHPNTVMRYIEWGLIPPVERAPNGYRVYTQRHLDCLRLARLVYTSYYPGKALRASANMMIEAAVADDWSGALEMAAQHLTNVEREIEQAEATVKILEDWAERIPVQDTHEQKTGSGSERKKQPAPTYSIGEACELLHVTRDVLRNWERNGLIEIPRNEANGYRLIGAAEIERLKIIRLLSQAGYSMMAMLRMFVQFDRGERSHLREALDTPNPDEDVYMAADRWLTVLNLQRTHSLDILHFLESLPQSKRNTEKA